MLTRDWNGMIALGGNIYFTAKHRRPPTARSLPARWPACMSGMTEEEYADMMMLDGGRSVEGNRLARKPDQRHA